MPIIFTHTYITAVSNDIHPGGMSSSGHSHFMTQQLNSTVPPDLNSQAAMMPQMSAEDSITMQQMDDGSVTMATTIAASIHGNGASPAQSREPTPIQRVSPIPNGTLSGSPHHRMMTNMIDSKDPESSNNNDGSPVPSPTQHNGNISVKYLISSQ